MKRLLINSRDVIALNDELDLIVTLKFKMCMFPSLNNNNVVYFTYLINN